MNAARGQVIKTARLLKGYGLREFAEFCGIEPGHYYDLECGEEPSQDEWGKINKGLQEPKVVFDSSTWASSPTTAEKP